MKKLILVIIFLILNCSVFAQEIKGKVVDENNQPLPFVSIVEENTQNGTQSNIDGSFYLKLLNDKSNVIIFCVGFENLTVRPDKELFLQLKSKSITVNEIEISAKKINSSENILLIDKKNSTGIESSIGVSEMSKKGISNVEEGLKKVSGISFNNSRLNIRGLDDRYNQVTLNGIPIPSNNADKKNIDLNLLPTGMLSNLKIKKTYSSEQWSNVGGAQIDLNTVEIRNIKNISIRTSLNSLTPKLNYNLNFQFGNEYKKFGYFLNVNLINDNQNSEGLIRLINKQGNNILNYNFKDQQTQFTPSGILSTSLDLKNFNLSNTVVYINQKNNLYRETFGYHFDYNKDIFTTRNTPSNHILFTDQLSLNYHIKKLNFKTDATFSFIKSGENAREQFVYLYDGEYQFNNIDKLDNHVFWNENIENRINLNSYVNYKGENFTHDFGYVFLQAKNVFNYRQKYYDLGQINSIYDPIDPNSINTYLNSNDYTEFWINDPASKTEGTTFINGLYYKSLLSKSKNDLSFGVRLENVNQTVIFRDQLSPIFLKTNRITNLEFLPFVSLKHKINQKKQIKISSSISSLRPRFRETVPFIYTEVFAGSKIQGNPGLTISKIYNLDLGFEFYPKDGEVFSFNLFGKYIKDPIERINVATASGRLETFQNSEASKILGGEIEIKKKIKKLVIDYNLSLLWSKIIISDIGNSTVVVSNFSRPLQGSSPILSNLDVFYIFNENQSLGFTYNLIGKKLNSVGVFGLGDIYQSPQNFINFIYNLQFKKYSLSLRINNLLNTKYKFTQQSESGEIVTNEYKLGQDFSFNIRYNF